MTAMPLRERSSWKALESHYAEIGGLHLRVSHDSSTNALIRQYGSLKN